MKESMRLENIVAQNLKRYRIAANVSEEDASRVARGDISLWEDGINTPTLYVLARLAYKYRTEPANFLRPGPNRRGVLR